MTRPYVHDTLEREYAHGRVSLPGYGAAKIYQRILEAAEERSPGPMQQDEATHKRILDIAGGLAREMTDTQMAREHRLMVRRNMGDAGRLLEDVLVDGKLFSEIAESKGLRSSWAVKRISSQFATACNTLAALYDSQHAERLLSRQAVNNE